MLLPDPVLLLRPAYCKGYPFFMSTLGKGFIWYRQSLHYLKPHTTLSPAAKKHLKSAYAYILANPGFGKTRAIYVHRAVALAYLPNTNLFATEVDHINGNKYDNRLCNLEWVTHEENMRRRRQLKKSRLSTINYQSSKC